MNIMKSEYYSARQKIQENPECIMSIVEGRIDVSDHFPNTRYINFFDAGQILLHKQYNKPDMDLNRLIEVHNLAGNLHRVMLSDSLQSLVFDSLYRHPDDYLGEFFGVNVTKDVTISLSGVTLRWFLEETRHQLQKNIQHLSIESLHHPQSYSKVPLYQPHKDILLVYVDDSSAVENINKKNIKGAIKTITHLMKERTEPFYLDDQYPLLYPHNSAQITIDIMKEIMEDYKESTCFNKDCHDALRHHQVISDEMLKMMRMKTLTEEDVKRFFLEKANISLTLTDVTHP